MTLVIMAAGMGSRFGGLKQIEPIGPNGEFIIDYSIYDAIRAGFDRVVFIIKEENYDIFRDTIGKRVENKIKVEYVFQNNDNVPSEYSIPETRKKPLGTGHAILCCKDVVKDNFAIINADDFYGYDAFKVIADFLKNNKEPLEQAMVGYKVANTLTKNGSVKRGVCKEENGYLTHMIETAIEKKDECIIAEPLEGGEAFEVGEDDLVSMNMFGFKQSIFKCLEDDFRLFLNKNKENLEKCEYLLPFVICDNIEKGSIKTKVLKTNSEWYGVTYKEDKDDVVASIQKIIDDGEYPLNLWK